MREIPRPDFGATLVLFMGTAILSSKLLATAIQAYLKSHRTKVTISSGSSKVTYEGPNLKEAIPEIEHVLDAIVSKARSNEFDIRAEFVERKRKRATLARTSKPVET